MHVPLDRILQRVFELGLSISMPQPRRLEAFMDITDSLTKAEVMLHGSLWEALRLVAYYGQSMLGEDQLNGHCMVSVKPLGDINPGFVKINMIWKRVNETAQRWDGEIRNQAGKRVARFSVGYWSNHI